MQFLSNLFCLIQRIYEICLISLSKFSDELPIFTCARAICNLPSICLGVTILRRFPYFALYLTSDRIEE